MELKDFLAQLLRNWILILVFAVLGFLAALFFNQSQKEFFQASLLLYLKPEAVSGQESKNFSVGYYNQLKIREFSDNFIAALLQPEIQKEIGRKFQLKKLTPQLLRLTVSEEKKEDANTAVLTTTEAIGKMNTKFAEDDQSFFRVETLTFAPSLEKIEQHQNLNLLVGLLLGLVFGILVISLKIYFYPK